MSPRRRRFWFVSVAAAVVVAGLGVAAYFVWFRSYLPGPDSAKYQQYVEAFEVGLAALDTERSLEIGGDHLTQAVQIIPEEPAGWADRGLMFLRDHQFDRAASDLARAHELAPASGEIEALLGWLAKEQGKYADAVGHFQKAVRSYPRNLHYLYALADAVQKQGGPDADAEYQRLIEDGLKVQPNNLFLLRERLGTAVRRGDRVAVDAVVARFKEYSPEWDQGGREEFTKFVKTAAGPLPGDALDAFAPFSNTLAAQRGYQRDLGAVFPAAGLEGEPVAQFLRLAPTPVVVAAPDLGVTFTLEPLAPATPGGADAAWVVWLNGQDCQPAVYVADGKQVHRADAVAPPLPFPGGPRSVAPSRCGVVAADFDNAFRTDLLLAGAGGLRFWRQQKDGGFVDVTAKRGLGDDILGGDYFGAWAADVDLDGDLDFIAAPRSGPPFVLRNNGDGTFTAMKDVFPNVADVRDFAWADFDHDGAADAAFLDAGGRITVFLNQRGGKFTSSALPEGTAAGGLALSAADVNADGVLDLLVLGSDGAVRRLSNDGEGNWTSVELAFWDDFSAEKAGPGAFRLLVGDLDNNGALDLVAAGPAGARVWMGASPDQFRSLPVTIAERVFAIADLDGDGRLDLLGLSADGFPLRLRNAGTKDYHWRDVRPYANAAELNNPKGDNRVNSFGLGAEVEVRAGLLVQKQIVTAPVVHFGLGGHEKAQVLRIVWPNGDPQVEFALDPTQACVGVQVQQRLTGSCPFLFAWNGEQMDFVTDVLWSSPLGLYINAQNRGGIVQTTDWVKVRGDQLKPRDGMYDVRITADLWETHFFDHVHLTVVDHPADTEMYVDERFFLTPTEPQLYLTQRPRPIARATDDHGDDVTDVVRRIDGRYLDSFQLGKYQGVAADHFVEVDLGDDAPKTGPVYLLATGWIHPTDSSINAAIEQGGNDRPHGLVLEVPDGKGGWTVGRPALGFPAGKNKTIVIRLDGIPGQDGVARRFRLRTNIEIYWDALAFAEGLDSGGVRQTVLQPDTAELRYRGVSRITRADASSPELPDYDKLVSRSQYWRDLIGYYTRYGDVRELLDKIDDRYVIMNAGDEIALTFRAPDGPPPGWKRDFVWVSDGWEKDGNFNTRFSKTVLPLPYHGMTAYETPPGRLEDDPVYQRHRDDWKKYHTRYVTPAVFERGCAHCTLNSREDPETNVRPILKQILFIAILAGLLGAAFALDRSGAAPSAPFDRKAALQNHGFYLEEVAKKCGVAFVHHGPTNLDPKLQHILPVVAAMGASVSVVDFDRDGWPDLFVVTGAEGGKCALYRNQHDGTFKDVAEEVGLADLNREGTGVCMGAVWGDYDNDGYEDVLVYKWGRPVLYHNDAGKHFTPVAAEKSGLPDWMNANSALWFDYDRDGKLDLFIAGYWRDDLDLWHLADGKVMPDSFEYATNGGGKHLLHNNGDGTFTDVTEKMGVSSKRWTLAVAAASLCETGYPDLFLANDYGVSEIYANREGKKFEEVGEKVGVGHSPKSGMNASFGDVHNTGRFSVYVSNISEPGVLVQGNNLWTPVKGCTGDNLKYQNLANPLKVELGGWSWGAQFVDLNNDGLLDLYLTNGYISADKGQSYWYEYSKIAGANGLVINDAANWPAIRDRSLSGYQPKHVWLNKGGNFVEVAAGVGVQDQYDGRSVATADLWNRGVQDVIVANQNGPLLIYKNTVAPGNHWVQFDLEGAASNRSAIGAEVRLFWDRKQQAQVVSGGDGYASQRQRRLHFGLGKSTEIDKVVIQWPSGLTQTVEHPEADTVHAIQEGP